jgi:putative PIN family toxin of toxin-antitoxin system
MQRLRRPDGRGVNPGWLFVIRVVLDTNIVVSALLQPLGPPAQLFVLVYGGSIQLCISGSVYAEYEEVIRRPRFRRSEDVITAALQNIREKSLWARPTETIRACSDPDDDMFLECGQLVRTPYGLAFSPTGELREVDHGPRGGDELNLIEKGKNYGWPLVSYGQNYNGVPIPKPDTRPDLAEPVLYWAPVIAPGNPMFYTGSKTFPQWNGNGFVRGLATKALVRIVFDGHGGAKTASAGMWANASEMWKKAPTALALPVATVSVHRRQFP